MKIWIGISILLIVTGCRIRREVRQVVNETVKVVREVERDTMILATADSSWLKAWLECDSTGQIIMRELVAYQAGQHAGIPQVKIDNNMLTTKVVVDSFAIFLKLRDKYETITTARIETIEKVKEVNHLKQWQRIFIVLGIIFLIQLTMCIRNRFFT